MVSPRFCHQTKLEKTIKSKSIKNEFLKKIKNLSAIVNKKLVRVRLAFYIIIFSLLFALSITKMASELVALFIAKSVQKKADL
jgi:hypothetical protein